MFISTKHIIGAWNNNGFYSANIVGARGHGKSSYALQVLHEVLMELGYDDETAWNMTLGRILYKIPDIIKLLDVSVGKDKREVCFIWDDAGVFGSGQRWFTHHNEMQELHTLMDTIREASAGILLTCPDLMQLAKFLRRYDDYLIRISFDPRGGMYRIAKGYIKRVTPAQQVRVYTKFYDKYNCRLPNWVYAAYSEKRKQYNKENLEELKKIYKKRDSEKKDGEKE